MTPPEPFAHHPPFVMLPTFRQMQSDTLKHTVLCLLYNPCRFLSSGLLMWSLSVSCLLFLLTLSSIDFPPSVCLSVSFPGASSPASDSGSGHCSLHPAGAVLLHCFHPPAAPQQTLHPPHHHIWWVVLISTVGSFFPYGFLKIFRTFKSLAEWIHTVVKTGHNVSSRRQYFKCFSFFLIIISPESHKNAGGLFISLRTQLADWVQSLFMV